MKRFLPFLMTVFGCLPLSGCKAEEPEHFSMGNYFPFGMMDYDARVLLVVDVKAEQKIDELEVDLWAMHMVSFLSTWITDDVENLPFVGTFAIRRRIANFEYDKKPEYADTCYLPLYNFLTDRDYVYTFREDEKGRYAVGGVKLTDRLKDLCGLEKGFIEYEIVYYGYENGIYEDFSIKYASCCEFYFKTQGDTVIFNENASSLGLIPLTKETFSYVH